MPNRNVEDLILQSLRVVIASNTDVPSGRIWLKKPASEFVSNTNGANTPSGTVITYPAIGITYLRDAKYDVNNYGNKITVVNNDGTSIEYLPLAEINLMLAISLFTESRKQQREQGNKLSMCLLSNALMPLIGDELTGEYAGIKLLNKKDLYESKPYREVYVIKACSRILREVSGYTVNLVDVNQGIGFANNVEVASSGELTPWFTTASSGTTWY